MAVRAKIAGFERFAHRFRHTLHPVLGAAALATLLMHNAPDPGSQPAREKAPAATAEQLAEQKRWADAEALATPFGRCAIVGVTDTHREPNLPRGRGKGRTTITVDVLAPLKKEAVTLYKKYTGGDEVQWSPPVGIGALLDGRPEQLISNDLVADDNFSDARETRDVTAGQGRFNLYPYTDYPTGTRIGVYVETVTETRAMGEDWTLYGDTPCGQLELQRNAAGNATWVEYRGRHAIQPVIEVY